MGTIYAKRGKLYVGYKDLGGKWSYGATEFKVGQEEQARKFLDAVERRVKAALEMGAATLGPVTVRRYAERWIGDRRDRRVGSARDDETRLRRHALPQLGQLVLGEVRPGHIRALVRSLKGKVGTSSDHLAPRTVRHVYGVLHRMFEDAVADELIASNPCAIKRGELPAKIDKDPTWRSGAVFTREEVERLISDERVPEERRVLYALLLSTGMRIGEVAALRWRAYDNTSKPLGRLLVATSFNRKRKAEKGVKTDRPREVPVHPTLAKVLAGWKLSGWQKLMGRAPNSDDLLICAPTENHLKDNLVYDNFQRDLRALGLRPRRVHDTRRTFVSLSLADGARKDVLRWITHGPEGDIVSLYTTLPWDALCAEVAKLRIEPLVGQLLELRKAANSNGEPGADGAGLLPPLLPPHRLTEKAQHSHALESSRGSAQGGTRNLTSEHQPGQSEHISPEISAAFNEPTRARCSPVESDRSNVVSARSIAERDEVADLEAIRTVWLRNPDEKSLRSALLDLLRRLEDRE